MRILLISDYAYVAGGAELMMKWMRDELNRRGHEARLFSTDVGGAGVENFADDLCFGTESFGRTLLQCANPWAAIGLSRLVREFRPHVVHLRLFLTQLSPLILPVLETVPSIYHVAWYRPMCPLGTKMLPDGSICRLPYGRACLQNGCLPRRDWLPLMLQMRMLRRWRHHLDRIVANSREVHSRLVEAGFGPVEVVHNGIPVSPPPAILPSAPVVGFAGRLVPTKGARTLIRAFQRVARCLPEARLLIAGDGPERAGLESDVRRMGLAGRIEFLGHVTYGELAEKFREVQVHAVPSQWAEPFGIVAVEAMMRGQPVVATNHGGLTEIVVDGETGILVPPGDADALADAIVALLQNRKRAESMGAAGYRRAVERFSLEAFYQKFVGIYDEMALRC